MSNIIDINEVGWKTEDYIDSPDAEGHIHQHLVKVASYVTLQGRDDDMAIAASEATGIGAYEYAPGGWITDHTHDKAEQWYYILKGKGLMKVGDEEKMAQEGSIIFVPRNTVHSYKVVGDEPLRFLNVAVFLPD